MQYQTLLTNELQEVKGLMLHEIDQVPTEISPAISKLINRGGKQLRPSLVILACYMSNAPYQSALYAAAAVEMLHTATLIHDDLIDNAIIRRGVETLNVNYSSAATVLSGDITFAFAAKFAALSENVNLVNQFAQTLEKICRGELNQMLNGHNSIPTVAQYFKRISAKTASLFSLCTESGAILAGDTSENIKNAGQIGHHLGLAFQIADDVLDFMGSENLLGKPVGGDLKEGLITLPILHFFEQNPDDNRLLAILHNHFTQQDLNSLIYDLRHSDAAEWAMQMANHHISQALHLLTMMYPKTQYRNAIEEIAHFAVKRRY